MNRKSLSVLVALSSCLLVSQAPADMMYYQGIDLHETATLHAHGLLADNLTVYAGQIHVGYQGLTHDAYCVDIDHYAGNGQVTPATTAILPHGDLVDYLLDTYASGVTTNHQAAALAVAVWEVVFETANTFDATGGYFYVTNNGGAAADANALLAAMPAHYQTAAPHVVLGSPSVQGMVLVDVSDPVPEPATLVLMGLAGLGLTARRHWRRG